jgi:hypothetical protein
MSLDMPGLYPQPGNHTHRRYNNASENVIAPAFMHVPIYCDSSAHTAFSRAISAVDAAGPNVPAV